MGQRTNYRRVRPVQTNVLFVLAGVVSFGWGFCRDLNGSARHSSHVLTVEDDITSDRHPVAARMHFRFAGTRYPKKVNVMYANGKRGGLMI